jgi:hypothetical protein
MTRATWLLMVALLLPAPLFAADARELFDTGAKALSDGKADEALTAFEAAYKAQPSSSLLFWLGEAHLALGHKERAARFYRRYLEKLPAGIKASDAHMRLAVLKQEMPERRRKSRTLALEDVDLSKAEAAPPARKHSRKKGKKRRSAPSESAPPAAALPLPLPAPAPAKSAAAPPLVLPLPAAEPASAKSSAVPPPPLPLPGEEPVPAQSAATPPAAGTTVAQLQRPAAWPPPQPRPQPTRTGSLITSAPGSEPGTYTYVNYTARLLAPNGSFMANYATTVSPGNGTIYTHGISIGRQMEYFKTGLYFGFGTQYGGPFGAGTDTLLRYELSLEGIWVPLGSDSIFSPYVGVRAGGMGVKSERLTGGSFKPGVVLAPMAGLGLQLGPFALTAGMGYDANLGPDLGPNASISGYSFDLGATLRL